LLIAFSCAPGLGGEAALGWNMARELGRRVNLTVVCAARDHRIDFSSAIAQHRKDNDVECELVTVDPPPFSFILEFSHDHGLTLVYHFWYIYYQWHIWRTFRHRLAEFDVIHQLNYISFRYPGWFWKQAVSRFVWGPIGGGAQFPSAFLSAIPPRAALLLRIRNFVNACAMRSAILRKVATRADAIICATPETRDIFSERPLQNVHVFPETGTDPHMLATEIRFAAGRLRVAWAGVGHPRKMPQIVLSLFAKCPSVDFHIFSNSPVFNQHRHRPNVFVHAPMARADFIRELSQCDVLVHTSLIEGTPHVICEALSRGLAVVAHDCCGMAAVLDEHCGFKVPVVDFATSARLFANQIAALDVDRDLLARLKVGALLRATEMTWERKADAIFAIYESILSTGSDHRRCDEQPTCGSTLSISGSKRLAIRHAGTPASIPCPPASIRVRTHNQ
jgi:glycosyltransferase involved in cell wall biosynthesis